MANVTTELGVANLALQRIGVKASTDLAGTDKKSVAANRILSLEFNRLNQKIS